MSNGRGDQGWKIRAGSEHPNARLGDAAVDAIRADGGATSVRALAARYHVGKSTVQRAQSGESYQHSRKDSEGKS
jgi:hypothetical protein